MSGRQEQNAAGGHSRGMCWCGQTARFSVPLPSTASFDRLLPMAWRYAVAQAGQKRDLGLKIAGNPANAGPYVGWEHGVRRPLRVLICNERFLPRFGHDRSLVLLARHLTSLGHEVALACLRYERQVLSTITEDIHQLEIDAADVRLADRLASEAILASWGDNCPDLLVTGGWPFFEVAARSRAYGVPSVFIDAGAVPHDGCTEPDLSRQREVRRLRQRTLPFIGCVLPNSDFIRDSQSIPDRGHDTGVTTIRHGCDHMGMRFEPAGLDPDVEQALLAKLDSLRVVGSALILALGRFEDQGYKNSPMVFDVFRAIRQSVSSVYLLVLVGPATVSVPLDLADNTMCLGTLSDATLEEVMRRCALGLSMSLWEGFNAPLAEMQWLARPVLAFNVAAHPEVVADPWFLCAGATEMARKAVLLLTQGIPKAITSRARFERFHENFGWSKHLHALDRRNRGARRDPVIIRRAHTTYRADGCDVRGERPSEFRHTESRSSPCRPTIGTLRAVGHFRGLGPRAGYLPTPDSIGPIVFGELCWADGLAGQTHRAIGR